MTNFTEFKNLSLDDFIRGRAYHKEHGNMKFVFDELPNIDDLVNTLGGQSKTKAKVQRVLEFHLSSIGSCGILGRVNYDAVKNEWSYCAGQDYPSELSYIRKLILKA